MYVIIWKYEIKLGKVKEFEQAYGSRGVWYDFFRKGDGYKGTQLLKDQERANGYVTLDHWESKRQFDEFNQQHSEEYQNIDRQCARFTVCEERVGGYEEKENNS